LTRAFFNDGKAKSEHFPSVSAVRTTISPQEMRACGLSLSTGDGNSYVLPSAHMRRDFAFHETFEGFFSAAERDVQDRQREPEFCDSAFFQERPAALLLDATPPRRSACFRCSHTSATLSTLCAVLRTWPSALLRDVTTMLRMGTAWRQPLSVRLPGHAVPPAIDVLHK